MTAAGKRNAQRKGTEMDEGTEQRTSELRMKVRPALEIHDTDVARLVLATDLCITTVQRWKGGRAVNRTTILRLERAMKKLGIVRRERALSPSPARARRVVVTPSKAA